MSLSIAAILKAAKKGFYFKMGHIHISIQNVKIFENNHLRWFILRIRIGKRKKKHFALIFSV